MKDKSHLFQGLIVFFALFLLIALLLWLSKSGLPFGSFYRLEVKFDSAGGLFDQAKVLMRGFRIGSVKGVRFEPDGIIVTVSIDRKYQIPVGSTFAIVLYNFIGERAVDIVPSRSEEYLKPGERIRGESRDMMADTQALFSELRKKLAEFGWEKIERLASQLQAALEKIPARLSSLIPPQFREDLVLLEDTARQIKKTFGKIDEQIPALASESRDFLKKLDGLIETAERNQNQLGKVLEKLNSADSSAGKMLQDKEFWEMTKETLDRLNEFLRELKSNPKKYFKFSIF